MSRFHPSKTALAVLSALLLRGLLGCGDNGSPDGNHPPPPTPAGGPQSAGAAIDGSGAFRVAFSTPAWGFGGSLGAPAQNIAVVTGSDALGAYHETGCDYADPMKKHAAIRAYDDRPVVLFSETFIEAAPNQAPFPTLSSYPANLYHLSYGDHEFAPRVFDDLVPDSPWIFFDAGNNAFVLSAANHFMNAGMTKGQNGSLLAGIADEVKGIPAGFVHQTLLVAEPGINRAFDTWGKAITDLTGKRRQPSDGTRELARLGYWTDNGASYYYKYDPAKGYLGTLLAVRDAFTAQGLQLGYLQLDSWWYPKGPAKDWSAVGKGVYSYSADPKLFPDGLSGFQTKAALPFITHGRWIDPSSPYQVMYQMSNNVSIDPAYWAMVAHYLKQGGVTTYEQDWINQNAAPKTDNLNDQDLFMDNMAAAMGAQGLFMQYCMPLPRHFLQGARYDNLLTMRVSVDRFSQERWTNFLYASRLAGALGAWPWADVFMSSEEDNLMLATLSAGLVGVGDPIDGINKGNLLKAVRPDGVIVKPDAAIVPMDETYIHGAQVTGSPVMAWTYSDHGAMRASYVFAFTVGPDKRVTMSPSALGYGGQVFIWDEGRKIGRTAAAAQEFSDDLAGGRGLYVMVPIGPSGIAFLGDAGKYVPLGRQRISELLDAGSVEATISFAAGEGPVTVQGHATKRPTATAGVGTVGAVMYDAASGMFSVSVTQEKGVAKISLR